MSGAPITRIEGLNRLASTMRRAGYDVGELKGLSAAVAGIVTPAAIAGTPVGPDAGGHIRGTVRAGITARAVTLRAGTGARGAYPYGGPLHWGWPARGIPARPWLADAAKAAEPAWVNVYAQGVQRIIDKVAGD